MKLLLALLGVSLAANAALFITRSDSTQAATAASSSASGKANTAAAQPGSPAASIASAKTSGAPADGIHAAFWEKVRAGDPSTVASLRAAGWPEDAIRAVVEGYVNDLLRPRERALRPDYTKMEYWRQNAFGMMSPETVKASRELNRERRAMLKKLIGDDYAPVRSIYTAQSYPGLTPAQIDSVMLINEDYGALRMEITGDFNAVLLPEDREKLAYLDKEMKADLAKVMTPEQQFEIDLRNSQVAHSLRSQLTAFAPSEEEFRKIFALQKAAADAASAGASMSSMTTAQRMALSQTNAAVDAQVKELLSPERYAEYVRAKDYEYRRLYQLTERLQLPKEKALAAYAVKADIEKRLREIRPAPGTDARTSMNEARAALAKEAEQLLIESLGQRGYEAYKGSGYSWLTALTPTTGFNPPRSL